MDIRVFLVSHWPSYIFDERYNEFERQAELIISSLRDRILIAEEIYYKKSTSCVSQCWWYGTEPCLWKSLSIVSHLLAHTKLNKEATAPEKWNDCKLPSHISKLSTFLNPRSQLNGKIWFYSAALNYWYMYFFQSHCCK